MRDLARALVAALAVAGCSAGGGQPAVSMPDLADGIALDGGVVPLIKIGAVGLAESQSGGGSATETAVFQDLTGTNDACARTVFGTCHLSICDFTSSPPDESAGDITFSDGASISLTTSFDGRSYLAMQNRLAWSPGSTITISAAGGTVPAFSATLGLAAPPTFSAPPPGTTIDRASDLPVSWQVTGDGNVFFVLSTGTARSWDLSCVFPAAAGAAVVPASLLAQLPAGRAAMQGGGGDRQILAIGDWQVSATVAIYGRSAMGTEYSSTVTLK
jgi:hypothetical protein